MASQESYPLRLLNASHLTTEQKAHEQLERRRRLTIKSPISAIDVPTVGTSPSQIQSAGTSSSGQAAPTEAMQYLSKALESLRNGLNLLEKNSAVGLYSKNMRPATSEDIFPKIINTLYRRDEEDVTRGTVDRHMAKIIDFAQVIRTASDFALVGHIASKAASKQVLLASEHGNNVNPTITSRIKGELQRIFDGSTYLIQAAIALRKSIGELRSDARKNRNEIARSHSDADATTAALARTSDIQKFLLAFSAFPFLLILASFAYGIEEGPDSTGFKLNAGLGTFVTIIQAIITGRTSSLKKLDTEYVKKAFESLNQLVVSLEKLETVVSGYEAVITEMRSLLNSDFFDNDILHPDSVVVWKFIEEKFKVLNEQGARAREFLDHHKMNSTDAPHLVDLTSGAYSAAALGL